jgi:uncharacterized protein YdeI (YjbR/CyaY-like superfamily)
MKTDEYPLLTFEEPAAWDRWLDERHAEARGVWLRLAKRGSGLASLTYEQALVEALRYGWIDGQARKHDEHSWLQKFTPRRPRSAWSRRNRERAERLIAEGKMHPAGLAAVEAARRDGRWDRAYAAPSEAMVPPDLDAALQASPDALRGFEALNRSNRFAVLYHIETAVKPETRARRITQWIEKLARGETPRR